MPKNEYKSKRFNTRVTDEDLEIINKERGDTPLRTYLTEIIHKFADEQRQNKK
jgi:hypothetical protein